MGDVVLFVLGVLVGGLGYRAYVKASSIGTRGDRDH
jgi:hypothetical protein